MLRGGQASLPSPTSSFPLLSLMPRLVAGLGSLSPPDTEHQVPPAHSPPSLSPISPASLPPLLLSLTSSPLPSVFSSSPSLPSPPFFPHVLSSCLFSFFPFQGSSPLLASPALSLPMPSSLRVLPASGHGTKSEDTEKQPGWGVGGSHLLGFPGASCSLSSIRSQERVWRPVT